jgi:hypothetical protein
MLGEGQLWLETQGGFNRDLREMRGASHSSITGKRLWAEGAACAKALG